MLTAHFPVVRCCRLLRCCQRLRCCLSVQFLLLMIVIALPGAVAAQVMQSNEIVKFRLRDGYLIVVQTVVNGAGPFNFLLDTGATHTVIDPDLARQLRLPVIGEASLTTVSDVRRDQLVRLKAVRVGNSEVSELGAVIDKLDRVKLKDPGIRGVLGEDFLSNFDLLIDYKERILRFDEDAPNGDRCRFETMGRYHGEPTTNRLLIEVEFMDANSSKAQLQLDTGAKMPEIFPARPGSVSSQPWAGSMAFSSGPNGTAIHPHTSIKIGTTIVNDLDVVKSRRGVAFDAVGLLPASIFHRIYISHSGGFVVLNPSE
jgi:predicted aspartyl protease